MTKPLAQVNGVSFCALLIRLELPRLKLLLASPLFCRRGSLGICGSANGAQCLSTASNVTGCGSLHTLLFGDLQL